jgi:hypothetical protein
MSFGVSVTRVIDDDFFASAPQDVNTPEWDRWFEEATRRTLVGEPVGGDGEFFNFWHAPAHELGLELLGRVYHHGLEVEDDALDDLAEELASLQAYWLTFEGVDEHDSVAIHGTDGVERSQPFRDYLLERAGNVRAAIEIAKRETGRLGIS